MCCSVGDDTNTALVAWWQRGEKQTIAQSTGITVALPAGGMWRATVDSDPGTKFTPPLRSLNVRIPRRTWSRHFEITFMCTHRPSLSRPRPHCVIYAIQRPIRFSDIHSL